jgi:hypothetical protein
MFAATTRKPFCPSSMIISRSIVFYMPRSRTEQSYGSSSGSGVDSLGHHSRQCSSKCCYPLKTFYHTFGRLSLRKLSWDLPILSLMSR